MSAIAIGTSLPGRSRITLAYALALVILAAAGYAAWYRVTYHVWPAQGASSRVHWCGRDYQTGGGAAQTWQQISATSKYPIRAVGQYPPLALSGQDLFAPAVPGATSGSCGMAVYLRTGTDAYQEYGLLGGL